MVKLYKIEQLVCIWYGVKNPSDVSGSFQQQFMAHLMSNEQSRMNIEVTPREQNVGNKQSSSWMRAVPKRRYQKGGKDPHLNLVQERGALRREKPPETQRVSGSSERPSSPLEGRRARHPFDYLPYLFGEYAKPMPNRNCADWNGGEDWSCCLCGSTEPKDKDTLVQHFIEHKRKADEERKSGKSPEGPVVESAKGPKLICPVCRKSFSKTRYMKHVLQQHFSRDFYCDECDVNFSDVYTISVHNKKHYGAEKGGYECVSCGLVCGGTSSLRWHVDACHKPEYHCEDCQKDFHTEKRFEDHKFFHLNIETDETGEKSNLHCEECRVSFPYKSNVDLHRSVIHPTRRPLFICGTCGKTFGTRYSLTLHSEVHDSSSKVRCDVCDKMLRRTFLRHHMRVTHAGEKPYTCDECGKRFTQRSTLKIHLRIHSGHRPYVCEPCGKGHVSRAALKSHRKKCPSKE